jgi:hypothetical protein
MVDLALSNHNPFDLVERNLIVAPIIEARCTSGLVVCHLLRDLAPSAVELASPRPVLRRWADESVLVQVKGRL